MIEVPDFLESGEIARLIPVISDSRKEQRAASALLAVFSAVPGFADAVLSQLGQRINKRTVVNTFTEIVLPDDGTSSKDRPDGLIILQSGQKRWTALVEAKIGKSKLEREQIERYLKLAKIHSIDALISISNEFVARPTHHPFSTSRALINRVDWFHLSWTSILTEAILLHENSKIADPEQAFLIREFVRFFSHESAGVNGYTQMPDCWNGSIKALQAGGNLKKHSDDVFKLVSGWHQEARELSLQLSQFLSRKVDLTLSKKHLGDPDLRVKDDISSLCEKGALEAGFHIPDAASTLFVVADLRTRTIRARMSVNAPTEKKTTKARINWLIRQLKETAPDGVSVRFKWQSKAADTSIPLSALRESVDLPEIKASNAPVRAFEVVMHKSQGGRFSGRKTFIEDIENFCPQFYENVGQHLKQPPRPTPPKPRTVKEKEQKDQDPPRKNDISQGNEHTALLEVPEFLRRMETKRENTVSSKELSSGKPFSGRISRFPSRLGHGNVHVQSGWLRR